MSSTTPLLDALRAQLGDRYAIQRELGRGGMGAVYLARDRRLDRPVALKVLPPEFADDGALRERFLRETRLAASFSHPNIVPVFAVEESPTLLAFAMGFVEGESLAARVRHAGPLTGPEAVRLLQDIGYALAYAHGRGVVHRDLKPDNVMIERATGRALLMDFGISRAIAAPADGAGLTRVGEIVGTPEFMSPEQASGDVVDGRSDLYSLALVAYFALTGELAITGESTQRIIVQQLTQPVPSVALRRPDLPAALVAVVDRCARKEPAERFARAEELVEALDASHLAAPEVPAVVRQFAQELGTVAMVLLFGLIVLDLIWEVNEARGWSVFDALTQQTFVVAILGGRLLQTVAEWRRLVALGYDGAVVRRGFAVILDEREAARAARRARPALVARRRRVVLVAAGMLVAAIVGYQLSLAARTRLGPMAWHVPPAAMVGFFASRVLGGIALVVLVRNPLRMPIGERLFRWLWLGPVGARLLRGTTGTTVPPTGVPTGIPARQPTPVAVPVGVATPASVARMEARSAPRVVLSGAPHPSEALAAAEARLAALERWREAEEARRARVSDPA